MQFVNILTDSANLEGYQRNKRRSSLYGQFTYRIAVRSGVISDNVDF